MDEVGYCYRSFLDREEAQSNFDWAKRNPEAADYCAKIEKWMDEGY